MVSMSYSRKIIFIISLGMSSVVLTGCPGPGDRMSLDETAQVSRKDNDVCMSINDARDYQPADMGINLRGTPPKEKKFNFSPGLRIVDGALCIPSSYYYFIDGNKYIVEFVLHSASNKNEPRNYVVGIGVNKTQVYNFPLTDREISRPYGSIEVSE
ncbi:putative T6SS immunity periplasmic lipoprotein [Scandinavium sp. NPDC088450]|uniref:putative T6SS immunity periplasmic lipoprotein n=1 Tax=Scandinavium sp. NPDC088450 TaxID=3364514 RepID=UPI00384C7C2C